MQIQTAEAKRERNGEYRSMHLHFAIKSASGSEKKLLVMDIFMVTASVWSLNVTVGRAKACWLLLDRGCRERGTTRDVQEARFGPFTNRICSYFCKSVGVVPRAVHQARLGPFFGVVTSSLCPWRVKGNSLGHFLSPVHKYLKIAVKNPRETCGGEKPKAKLLCDRYEEEKICSAPL